MRTNDIRTTISRTPLTDLTWGCRSLMACSYVWTIYLW